jgi:hypothetical protein
MFNLCVFVEPHDDLRFLHFVLLDPLHFTLFLLFEKLILLFCLVTTEELDRLKARFLGAGTVGMGGVSPVAIDIVVL